MWAYSWLKIRRIKGNNPVVIIETDPYYNYTSLTFLKDVLNQIDLKHRSKEITAFHLIAKDFNLNWNGPI